MARILSAEKDTSVEVDERTRFRRRVKRLSLLVVLIVVAAHLLVGMVASVFVVARYFAKPKAQFTAVTKQVDMKPEEREHKQAMDQVEAMRAAPVLNNRIQSLKPSALVLPDLPKVPVDTTIPIVAAAVETAQIGTAGGNAGSTGAGQKQGFFGDAGLTGAGLLEGVFYDLKQTPDGKPTDMTPARYNRELGKYMFDGWNDARFAKNYFSGPNKLYTRQIYIPTIRAEAGPKAFGLGDKVQPRMWAVVYRATVVPPVTGRMRFVGFGDDILVVRFNKKVVLDGSIFPPSGWIPKEKPPAVDRAVNRAGVVGEWINVRAGEKDKVDILIGEQPGGLFTAYVMCEYKDKIGTLSLFRLAGGTSPAPGRDRTIPAFDPSAPVWNVVNKSSTPSLPGLP